MILLAAWFMLLLLTEMLTLNCDDFFYISSRVYSGLALLPPLLPYFLILAAV